MSGKYHPGKCTQCKLCNRAGSKYKHFAILPDEFKVYLAEKLLIDSSCICYNCVKWWEQNNSRPSAVPPWASKQKNERRCQMEKCSNPWHSNSYLTSVSEAEETLGERAEAFCITSQANTIGLCREHYNALYTLVRPGQSCAFCGVKGKTNRRCPSVDVINTYLSYILEEHELLTADNHICLTCYKYFHHIASNKKNSLNHTHSR